MYKIHQLVGHCRPKQFQACDSHESSNICIHVPIYINLLLRGNNLHTFLID